MMKGHITLCNLEPHVRLKTLNLLLLVELHPDFGSTENTYAL